MLDDTIIRVSSGLMSRCFTLYQVYCLEKKYDIYPIMIIWPKGDGCSADYDKIFQKRIGKKLLTVHDDYPGIKQAIKNWNYKELCNGIKKKKENKYIKHLVDQYLEVEGYFDLYPSQEIGWEGERFKSFDKEIKNKILKKIKDKNPVMINTYCGFIDEVFDLSIKAAVVFRDQFIEEARLRVPNEHDMVGVHIRRTDHATSINNSKTEFFMEKMDELISENKEAKFFLSTDDSKEEETILDRYGSRVVIQERKTWGRDSEESIYSAVVDMLCLSRCKFILGSCGSVFSNFAANYGDVDLYVCDNGVERWKKTYSKKMTS